MRRPIAVLALLTALLPALLSAAADRAPLDEVRQAADALLAAAYPADGPGAAVLVKWKGEIVLRKGYGMAQMDLGIPVAPEQVFEIGSVTKQFTAATRAAARGAGEAGALGSDHEVPAGDGRSAARRSRSSSCWPTPPGCPTTPICRSGFRAGAKT